jgi:hypothetical protein
VPALQRSVHEQPAWQRIEFIWPEPRPAVEILRRLNLRPALDVPPERDFLNAVAASLAGSLGQADRQAMAGIGAGEMARRYRAPDRTFVFERGRWHLACAGDGALVGFTQPVVFRGRGRGGLDEGTIRDMEAVPYRFGNGYIGDLLRPASATPEAVGIRRGYADTAILNAPIGALERVG